jgi:hypothetical protein
MGAVENNFIAGISLCHEGVKESGRRMPQVTEVGVDHVD